MYTKATANPIHKSKKVRHLPHAMNSIAHKGKLKRCRFKSRKLLLNIPNLFLAAASMYALMTGTRTIHHTMTVIEHPTKAGNRTVSNEIK